MVRAGPVALPKVVLRPRERCLTTQAHRCVRLLIVLMGFWLCDGHGHLEHLVDSFQRFRDLKMGNRKLLLVVSDALAAQSSGYSARLNVAADYFLGVVT